MLADISSTVDAAMGSRAWWDSWGDWASTAVAVGVILESVTEFKLLARLTGLSKRESLREKIAKVGLVFLIVALVAEVAIGRHVKEQTDNIENALADSLRSTIAANADLSEKIKREKTDIGGVKNDIGTARDQVAGLGDKEDKLRSALAKDEHFLSADRARIVANEKEQEAHEEATTPRADFMYNFGEVKKALSPFSATPFVVSAVYSEDAERLAIRINEMLRMATGKEPDQDGPGPRDALTSVGIEYAMNLSAPPGTTTGEQAATVMCRLLEKYDVPGIRLEGRLAFDSYGHRDFSQWPKTRPLDSVLIHVGDAPSEHFVALKAKRAHLSLPQGPDDKYPCGFDGKEKP
jgi:hypothetical protein